jgi:hypothetical protein
VADETASLQTFKQHEEKKTKNVLNVIVHKGRREQPVLALLPVGKAVDAAVKKMIGMLDEVERMLPNDHHGTGRHTVGNDGAVLGAEVARRESLSKLKFLMNSGAKVGLPDFDRATLERLLQEHFHAGGGNQRRPHRPSANYNSASSAPRKLHLDKQSHLGKQPHQHQHHHQQEQQEQPTGADELASQLRSMLTSKLQQQTFNANVARFKLNPQPPDVSAGTMPRKRRSSKTGMSSTTSAAPSTANTTDMSRKPERAPETLDGTAQKGRGGRGTLGQTGARKYTIFQPKKELSLIADSSPTTTTTAAAARVAMAKTMASVGMATAGKGTVYDAIASARKLAAQTVAAQSLPFEEEVPWWRDDEGVSDIDVDRDVVRTTISAPNPSHVSAPTAASWRLKALASPLLPPKDERLGEILPRWSLQDGQHAINQRHPVSEVLEKGEFP